jgi:D-aminopeptidase
MEMKKYTLIYMTMVGLSPFISRITELAYITTNNLRVAINEMYQQGCEVVYVLDGHTKIVDGVDPQTVVDEALTFKYDD